MRKDRPAAYLLYLVCLLALTPGCQMFYRYRPVAVLVRDAETKKPIANADVHLCYPLSRDSLAPYDSSYHTQDNGIAHLRAASYGDFGVLVDASAPGYAPAQVNLDTEMIQRIEPAHPFETVEQRKPEFLIEMYAEPRFRVELVVPQGYHGLIKAEIQIEEDAPAPPGQRVFRYAVTDANTVLVKGPKVMGRVYPSDYNASYTDGSPVGREMTMTKVGFRWLRGVGKEQYFVVGTQPEYDLFRRTLPDDELEGKQHTSAAAGRGGHGGRHRRDMAD